MDIEKLKAPFLINREFSFEDSNFKETTNYWNIPIHTKKTKPSTFKAYTRPKTKENGPDLWLECVTHIQNKLQRVSYFPTFLVDMPPRIYLEEHETETAINRHYRYVFQDILDSLTEGLQLNKHVCQRIRDFQEKESNSNWLSILLGSPSKGPIDSVFQKISNTVTKEVLGSWQRIFQRSISANSIIVEWNVDSEKGNIPYATFLVSDGDSRYAINERSLGFRWFFSFLLFTSFKKASERKTIFLFDEPAANLHAKAQAELLTSFSRIASDGNKIIYSTHSHHMINPKWLGSAYIIENAALDYDKTENFGLDTKPTNIMATSYRQFISKSPSRSSYFQPVIEKLQYVAPELIGSGPYLIVEGISDYYALELARKSLGKKIRFCLMPGVGSGSSGPFISQLMGQAQKFLILLDDDREGRSASKRYMDEWFLGENTVITLQNIDTSFSGKSLESLICEESIKIIKESLNTKSKPSKKQIGWYLAEACAGADNEKIHLAKNTFEQLEKILDYANETFEKTH